MMITRAQTSCFKRDSNTILPSKRSWPQTARPLRRAEIQAAGHGCVTNKSKCRIVSSFRLFLHPDLKTRQCRRFEAFAAMRLMLLWLWRRVDLYTSLNRFWPLTVMAEPSILTTEWRNEGEPDIWVCPLPAPSTSTNQFLPANFWSLFVSDSVRGYNSHISDAKESCAGCRCFGETVRVQTINGVILNLVTATNHTRPWSVSRSGCKMKMKCSVRHCAKHLLLWFTLFDTCIIGWPDVPFLRDRLFFLKSRPIVPTNLIRDA
jgi:hypothetical protein